MYIYSLYTYTMYVHVHVHFMYYIITSCNPRLYSSNTFSEILPDMGGLHLQHAQSLRDCRSSNASSHKLKLTQGLLI